MATPLRGSDHIIQIINLATIVFRELIHDANKSLVVVQVDRHLLPVEKLLEPRPEVTLPGQRLQALSDIDAFDLLKHHGCLAELLSPVIGALRRSDLLTNLANSLRSEERRVGKEVVSTFR